jgi:hypothetical protein
MMPAILVKCPNSLPAYVRITVLQALGVLMVERGHHDGCSFKSTGMERIEFDQNKELAGLFLNDAWDLEKLAALADFYCVEEQNAASTEESALAANEA